MDLDQAFELAIDNMVKYGDTDVFPFPIEKIMLYDEKSKILSLLNEIHANFSEFMNTSAPIFESMLAPSGYTGFRWVTQIDPIWNAYFLGLVLSLSDKIEDARLSKEKDYVFSYRISPDDTEKSLYDTSYGWRKFHEVSLNLAKSSQYSYVLVCDIANFYQTVYHHRIENSLAKLGNSAKEIENNIMEVLQRFAIMKSYGLPIGGQASRVLAELLLNRIDRLLFTREIRFCRFVDDYHIFAKSEEELYSNLLYLSKILIENEGFSLQKSKTRIISIDEFIQTSPLNEDVSEGARNIFAVSLKFDPYSATAEEDYEKLKQEIGKLDILTVLSQEISKSRLHSSLMVKIIRTLQHLEPDALSAAVEVLTTNIEMLAPVFPNLMILFESVFDKLNSTQQVQVFSIIRNLINTSSYILKIDLNVLYAIRILAKVYNEDNEIVMLKIFDQTSSALIRRDIILIMAKWNATHWISDLKNRFSSLTLWEKRSFIIASYRLGDEGSHWRSHYKRQFSKLDMIYRDWASQRWQQNGWELPI